MTGGNTCSRWQPLILVYEALLPSSRHGIALKPPINNGRRALDRGARRPRRRFPTKSVDSIVRTLCTQAPKALNVSRTPCVSGVCAGHEAGALTLCELPRARLAYRFNRASSSPRTFILPLLPWIFESQRARESKYMYMYKCVRVARDRSWNLISRCVHIGGEWPRRSTLIIRSETRNRI